MYRKILFLTAFLWLSLALISQSHFPGYYAVYFTDKSNNTYDVGQAQQFLSARSLQRYQLEGIAVSEQDLPVSKVYLDSLQSYGVQLFNHSKWLNAALVICSDTNQLLAIGQYSKVQATQYLGPYDTLSTSVAPSKSEAKQDSNTLTKGTTSYGDAYHQLQMLGIPNLHQTGLEGDGVHIAVLDAGFWRSDKMIAFDSLRNAGRLLSSRDIVHPGNSVYAESTHGSHVLSTLAAIIPGNYRGAAVKASYHLIRTETTYSEYPVEEFHWVVGAELADSLGVDIITSSLSYHTYDDSLLSYMHNDLDGQTSLISKGADIAASKGILVMNSAGNDGQDVWRKIGFPGDADKVLTVGAVDSLENHAHFSSVGYTSDKRIKPDVAAMGQQTYLVSTSDMIFRANGTSFSAPIISGGIALLKQGNPDATRSEIMDAVKQSASQYLTPDSLIGYGIPNFMVADMILKNMQIPILEEEQNFKVLPNPFQYDLTLVYDAMDTQRIQIEIYDLTGKQVWNKESIFQYPGLNTYKLGNLNHLQDGVYFIRITSGSNTYSRKIIKHQ